jgi:uncharacterized protein (DUF1499 family)
VVRAVRLACVAGLACGVCLVPILSCSGKRPSNLGASGGVLAPCPASPNCVSSDATDAAHRVEAFALVGPVDAAWRIVREEVARLPRTTVADERPTYLHAECASALFGFVDDLELALRAPEGLVAVRSASRLGYSDLGVNRRRVEGLRQALRARGVVR